MYDNYLPDTLDANRLFPQSVNDRIGVISIPSNLFGEFIKPRTFEYIYTGSSPTFTKGKITDDENGNLFKNGSKVEVQMKEIKVRRNYYYYYYHYH